jgi:FAD-dependent urate hydroxylase
LIDRLLETLTDDDLARSPFPHFRHPIPRTPGDGPVTLLGDAAHTMPPTLAQGTNQVLLDTMVLCKALSELGDQPGHSSGELSDALRWYERTRHHKVNAVSWMASLQVSHSEPMLRPAALISDRFMTWALTTLLRTTSHRRMSADISRGIRGARSTYSHMARSQR